MTALRRKLLRDLWRSRTQVISIAAVVGCGVMAATAMRSTLSSVNEARNRYYAEYRFGDVFAVVKRAPESLASRIAAIPGVGAVQTRVVITLRPITRILASQWQQYMQNRMVISYETWLDAPSRLLRSSGTRRRDE